MADEHIGDRCRICRRVFKTRKSAKNHVLNAHPAQVPNRSPGKYVDAIWLDLRIVGNTLDARKEKQ